MLTKQRRFNTANGKLEPWGMPPSDFMTNFEVPPVVVGPKGAWYTGADGKDVVITGVI